MDEKFFLSQVEGLKEWWNGHAKEEFKTPLTQEEFALSVRKTYDRRGFILMPRDKSTSGREVKFYGKIFFWDSDYKDTAIVTD